MGKAEAENRLKTDTDWTEHCCEDWLRKFAAKINTGTRKLPECRRGFFLRITFPPVFTAGNNGMT
jgi:hypothetical protein